MLPPIKIFLGKFTKILKVAELKENFFYDRKFNIYWNSFFVETF